MLKVQDQDGSICTASDKGLMEDGVTMVGVLIRETTW